MTGSVASASNSATGNVLVIGPNWLGDGIMAMPALQALREQLPSAGHLHLLVKPGQYDLWRMHPDVDPVWAFPENRLGVRPLLKQLKSAEFEKAIILPNSFRSAVFPRLLGIPTRRGTRTQLGRGLLINDTVEVEDLSHQHQQWENARLLLGDSLPDLLPYPRLTPPAEARSKLQHLLATLPRPILSLVPGAARGPSKQWPAERFQAVARNWIEETEGGVAWLGTPNDQSLCELLNTTLGENGLVLAGSTSLTEFAAAVSLSDVVAANDSGGMHLAAALGTPVVGIFGITDPSRTGPLSPLATVLQHSEIRSRSVPVDSPEAREALAAVTVEEVTEAVLAFPRSADKRP